MNHIDKSINNFKNNLLLWSLISVNLCKSEKDLNNLLESLIRNKSKTPIPLFLSLKLIRKHQIFNHI